MRPLTVLFFCLILISCEKRELPVKPYDRGDLSTVQVEMGQDYKHQVWFSLHDNRIVSANLKTDWDLAFEASQAGYHILLNGSKAMKAFKTGSSSLDAVTDTAGSGVYARADMPSGNLDSTAVGDWRMESKVYVINRGYNEAGGILGYIKLKITEVSSSRYTIEYAEIGGKGTIKKTIEKEDEYNFIAFSFDSGSQLYIEPKRSAYDLCFTQYTHLFTDPYQYYQVTGVLNNPSGVRIAAIHKIPFPEINTDDTLGLTFSTRRDALGFDWKTFDLNRNTYSVDATKCFIIRDHLGFYYKFHFIDFYNSAGAKGYPKFEFKKL